eukprot:2291590-Amphidinium_carterae.2
MVTTTVSVVLGNCIHSTLVFTNTEGCCYCRTLNRITAVGIGLAHLQLTSANKESKSVKPPLCRGVLRQVLTPNNIVLTKCTEQAPNEQRADQGMSHGRTSPACERYGTS